MAVRELTNALTSCQMARPQNANGEVGEIEQGKTGEIEHGVLNGQAKHKHDCCTCRSTVKLLLLLLLLAAQSWFDESRRAGCFGEAGVCSFVPGAHVVLLLVCSVSVA